MTKKVWNYTTSILLILLLFKIGLFITEYFITIPKIIGLVLYILQYICLIIIIWIVISVINNLINKE